MIFQSGDVLEQDSEGFRGIRKFEESVSVSVLAICGMYAAKLQYKTFSLIDL
jgi:hypothetical protein